MTRPESGLTLIEILISLLVMVLGLVGILAVFPPALQASKESFEDTQGAILAESVANALSSATRFPVLAAPIGPNPHYEITLTHDSINSVSVGSPDNMLYYRFWLPNWSIENKSYQAGNPRATGTVWYHHPGTPKSVGTPATGKPEDEPEWRLVGDPWTKLQVNATRTTSDASEPLAQFAYSFDVRKVNTLEYLLLPGPGGAPPAYTNVDQLDPLVRVWEFRIHTFRTGSRGETFGTGTGSSLGGVTTKRIIATLTTRVSVR